MDKGREELLQALIEKMTTVMKTLHSGQCLPFGEFQLNRPQIMILFFIARRKDGVSSKDLATFLNVTSGAITQFIAVLVEKGFVQKEECFTDRRVSILKLTKYAKTKLLSFKKEYYKAIGPAFDNFTQKEMKTFLLLLGKIRIFSE